MKVLILCVDYNNKDDTLKFINRLSEMPNSPDVVLTCNSGSAEFSSLETRSENVFVYDFEVNLGYMEGANRGLQEYLKDHPLPDWVILSNTDIDFVDDDFFTRLSDDRRIDSLIAPDIVSADGFHQNPFLVNRPEKSKLEFLKKVYSHSLTFFLYDALSKIKSKLAKKKEKTTAHKIYAPHGSFIIIGRRYFEYGETLQHPEFLYGEELMIAERAARHMMSVCYDSSYRVLHAEHVSTGKLAGKFKAKCLKDSLSSVLNEYYR